MEETIYLTITREEIEELIHNKAKENGYQIENMNYHITSKRFDPSKEIELVDVKCKVKRIENKETEKKESPSKRHVR